MNKKFMLKTILFKLHNDRYKNKISEFNDEMLKDKIRSIIKSHLLRYHNDLNIILPKGIHFYNIYSIDDDMVDDFIKNNEVLIVKYLRFDIPMVKLYMSGCHKLDVSTDITLGFNNTKLVVNKKVMLQSYLFIRNLLEYDIIDNVMIIPHDLTENAKEALKLLLQEEFGTYMDKFETFEDIYTFQIVFDYLQLEMPE